MKLTSFILPAVATTSVVAFLGSIVGGVVLVDWPPAAIGAACAALGVLFVLTIFASDY